MSFDIRGIKETGYDITTAVLISNSNNYQKIKTEKMGDIKQLEKIITVVA